MARNRRWEILDFWSWNAPEGESSARLWLADRKNEFPGAQARLYRRAVRAGAASLPLLVGVVRREKPAPEPTHA